MSETLPTSENIFLGEEPLEYIGMSTTYVPRQPLFLRSDGVEVVSQFRLRESDLNINAFIEYERTFGRGEGFIASHATNPSETHSILRRHIENVTVDDAITYLNEYHDLANQIRSICTNGDDDVIADFIKKINQHRKNFPALYARKPKKKFLIKD